MSFLKHFIHNSQCPNMLDAIKNVVITYIERKKWKSVFAVIIIAMTCVSFNVSAKSEFVVVIDPGHGGKDTGAVDNNALEKEINLAVSKRLGELIEKKLSDTKVILTRSTDKFISLQERAEIANKGKGNLFISIHTNSVDTNNKNRATVAGASVYTLGNHKDDANMGVARRENSVIELENGYKQKYSGFDPNKDESYIIFEMAQKNDIVRSNRFAKNVQENLVKVAGRKDRGVHQAGFWVLWSTSMPSVLVELDFICNPESAKYMTSREGIDEMAEAIFRAVKVYEQNWRQSERMGLNHKNSNPSGNSLANKNSKESVKETASKGRDKKSAKKNNKSLIKDNKKNGDVASTKNLGNQNSSSDSDIIAIAYVPAEEERDMSHESLKAIRNEKKPRSKADGRRRRSSAARNSSSMRNVEGEIKLYTEFTGETERVQPEQLVAAAPEKNDANSKNNSKNNKKVPKNNSKDTKGNKQIASKDKKNDNNNTDKKVVANNRNSKSNKVSKELSPAMKYKLEQEQKIKEEKRIEKEQRKSLKANTNHTVAAKEDLKSKDSKAENSKKAVTAKDNSHNRDTKIDSGKKIVAKDDSKKKENVESSSDKRASQNKIVRRGTDEKKEIAKSETQSTESVRTAAASSQQIKNAGKRKSLKSHSDE